MPLPKQKNLSREEFLELLDDKDVAALWNKWKLSPDTVMRKDSTAFLAAINERSKTTLLQDVMGLRTVTLQMLRDILSFLSSQISAIRTTASVIVLKEEFNIAPQQVDAVLKWSTRALRHSSATWGSLAERFESDVKPVLKKVERYGHVEFTYKPESVGKFLTRTDVGRQSSNRRTVSTARRDEHGLKLRQTYVQKVADLSHKLSELDGRVSDAHAQNFVSDFTESNGGYRRSFADALGKNRKAEERLPRGFGASLNAKDHEVWTLFAEYVLALAESGSNRDVRNAAH